MSENLHIPKDVPKEKEKTSAEFVSTRTVDNITYTVISSNSETATQTLKAKLEAAIGREIAQIPMETTVT